MIEVLEVNESGEQTYKGQEVVPSVIERDEIITVPDGYTAYCEEEITVHGILRVYGVLEMTEIPEAGP